MLSIRRGRRMIGTPRACSTAIAAMVAFGSAGTAKAQAALPAKPAEVTPVLAPGAPMFLVTPARRATWARMKVENHWLYQLAVSTCNGTGTPHERYGDTGWACAWVYQVDGTESAAARVITKLKTFGSGRPTADGAREALVNNVILADWVWKGASRSDRDQIIAGLERWTIYALGKTGKPYDGGCRLSDADQSTLGCYFGPALVDVFTRSLPGAPRWLDSSMTAAGFRAFPVGGLVATDTMNTTARNAVVFFAQTRSRGGEEVESTDYNPGTSANWVMGAEGLKTALGVDHFPELQAYFRDYARRLPFEVTPDLQQAIEWGDTEHPHDFTTWLYRRIGILGMLAGITRNPTTQASLQAIWRRWGQTGFGTGEPAYNAMRLLIFYDPYLNPAPLPTGAVFAPGRGHLLVKDSTTLVSIEEQPPSDEDHQVRYVHNVTLYRAGEWALDHPYGYAGPANGPLATNGVSYSGFGAMSSKRLVRIDSGAGWWSVTGATGGPLYGAGYSNPPPPFLRLGQRTTLYTTVNGWSVVVTFDSVLIDAPTRLDRYRPADGVVIAANPGWFAVWHPAVVPTATAGGWTWQTRGGQTVQITTFGRGVTGENIDEHTLWPTGGTPAARTKAQQLRIRTTGPTLLSVVLVGRGEPPVVARTPQGVTIGRTSITITGTTANVQR